MGYGLTSYHPDGTVEWRSDFPNVFYRDSMQLPYDYSGTLHYTPESSAEGVVPIVIAKYSSNPPSDPFSIGLFPLSPEAEITTPGTLSVEWKIVHSPGVGIVFTWMPPACEIILGERE